MSTIQASHKSIAYMRLEQLFAPKAEPIKHKRPTVKASKSTWKEWITRSRPNR